MNISDIEKLLSAFDKSKATSLHYVSGDGESLSLKKKQYISSPSSSHTKEEPPMHLHTESPTPSSVQKSIVNSVNAPLVGTFYRSPSPESGPFVQIGQQINAGDVVCIIEAMKIMNQIKAEVSGKVVSIEVEDGQAVEYGQPIFIVE